jgi:putative FmdB family regulatory protein
MPNYNYQCSECSKIYNEQRDVAHPQWKTHCDLCGAVYNLVTEEI